MRKNIELVLSAQLFLILSRRESIEDSEKSIGEKASYLSQRANTHGKKEDALMGKQRDRRDPYEGYQQESPAQNDFSWALSSPVLYHFTFNCVDWHGG